MPHPFIAFDPLSVCIRVGLGGIGIGLIMTFVACECFAFGLRRRTRDRAVAADGREARIALTAESEFVFGLVLTPGFLLGTALLGFGLAPGLPDGLRFVVLLGPLVFVWAVNRIATRILTRYAIEYRRAADRPLPEEPPR